MSKLDNNYAPISTNHYSEFSGYQEYHGLENARGIPSGPQIRIIIHNPDCETILSSVWPITVIRYYK